MRDLPKRGDLFAGRYLIKRQLGEGGFAAVFDCRVEGSNEGVALKLLHPNANRTYDRDTIARFNREASALAHLHGRATTRSLRRKTRQSQRSMLQI